MGDRIVSASEPEASQEILRSNAEDGIVAEVQLSHPQLFLQPTLGPLPRITLEPEYWTTLETGARLVFLTAIGDDFDRFERALARDSTVTDPLLIDRSHRRRTYRLQLTDRARSFDTDVASHDGRLLEASSTSEGWEIQVRFPDRPALVAFNHTCREDGMTIRVNHLRSWQSDDPVVVGLTPKQQELLSVAYEEGYFDVPRGISQDELADRMDVSKSAISQRMRRAIAQLCCDSLV